MSFLQVQSEKPPLQPDIIFSVGNFPISNVALMSWLVMAILLILCLRIKKGFRLVPGRLQSVGEVIVQSLSTAIFQIVQRKKATALLLPIIGTLFLFIIFSNLLGLVIPGLSAITYDGVALFRTPTTDFNMTIALALGMSVLTHIMSISASGLFGHIGKFIPLHKVVIGFKKSVSDGAMSLVDVFIGVMDIISEFAKLVSLSMRLFGNLYAGEVMMGILYGLIGAFIPAVWLGMSLLSGTVQAVVFAMLTTVFYSLMVASQPEDDE
ncbi:MAG: F0F1 ATP synthase subunit A [Candidatus Magasanikbacteria bacterium]|jgi:F-type H+-transporting ATPase subunit a|nr:F0F1 ATP synthase subunit A [Candidatus Magasanikbacteria bacterium]